LIASRLSVLTRSVADRAIIPGAQTCMSIPAARARRASP
jgi:hypothetical protein